MRPQTARWRRQLTRLAIIACALSLVIVLPRQPVRAAAPRTATTSRTTASPRTAAATDVPATLLMVHGYQDTCDGAFNKIGAQDPGPDPVTTRDYFSGIGWSGRIDEVGYYSDTYESGCDHDAQSTAGASRCSGTGTGTDLNDPILHLGCLMAWYIWDTYTTRGEPVDILAHSMGGLVVRAAIGLSGQPAGSATYQAGYPPGLLNVVRVVTVATPHGGLWGQYAKQAALNYPSTEVADMTVGSAFMNLIGQVQRPQGEHGTWWGLMAASQTCNLVAPTNGSLSCIALYPTDGDTSNYPFPDGDGVVQSASAMSMNADYKILYGWVQKASASAGQVDYTDYVAATNTQYSHEANSCFNLAGHLLCLPSPFYLNDADTTPTNAWSCTSNCTHGFADLDVDAANQPAPTLAQAPRSLTKLGQLLPAPPTVTTTNVGHAKHAGNDYPWETIGLFDHQNEGTDPWNEFYGQCDSFAAWKAYENLYDPSGSPLPPVVPAPGFTPPNATISNIDQNTWGNAGDWYRTAPEHGWATDLTPRPGSIAFWDNGHLGPVGHVAYVTDVYPDGSVTLENYNLLGNGQYSKFFLPVGGGPVTSFGQTITVSWPDGFAHIGDGPALDSSGNPLPPDPKPGTPIYGYPSNVKVIGPGSGGGQFTLGDVWYLRAAHGLLGSEEYTHTNGTTAVSTATWHPTGLDTGTCYRVDALVPDNYSDNPAAVYQVSDARATVMTAVNENTYTDDWAELGVFQPRPDGTMTVVLDDRGTTGLYVAADAMRFWKASCGGYGHSLLIGPGTPGFATSTGWTTETGLGFAGQMRWVATSGNSTADTPTRSASWTPAAGTLVPNACYEIQAFVPNDHSDNHAARYHVQDQYFSNFWPQVEENAFTNQFASLGVFQAWGNGTLPVTLLDDGPSGQFVAADELAYTQVDCSGLGNRYGGFQQLSTYIGPGSDPASFTTTDYWYSGIGHGWAHHDLWTYSNGAAAVSTVTWTAHLNANACYQLAAWIPANFYANNTTAHYTVTIWNGGNGAGGPLGPVNQANIGDAWAPLGQITTSDGHVTVSLDDTGPTGTYTAADTLRFTPC